MNFAGMHFKPQLEHSWQLSAVRSSASFKDASAHTICVSEKKKEKKMHHVRMIATLKHFTSIISWQTS